MICVNNGLFVNYKFSPQMVQSTEVQTCKKKGHFLVSNNLVVEDEYFWFGIRPLPIQWILPKIAQNFLSQVKIMQVTSNPRRPKLSQDWSIQF